MAVRTDTLPWLDGVVDTTPGSGCCPAIPNRSNLLARQIHVNGLRDDQERVYHTLTKVCQDPEWVVRYAGIVGLQGLASAVPADRPAWFSQLLAQLQQIAQADAELVVRARAVLATQTLTA